MDDFPSKKYLPKNEDCIPLIENIKNYFNKSDIIFGNLEGCISNDAPPRKGVTTQQNVIYIECQKI